ncbi:MAG: acyl-CoA dehydratase activase, partial [Spirochaetota bacterium]
MAKSDNTVQRAHGICLGASTVSAVSLSRNPVNGNRIRVEKVTLKTHEGNPKAAFEQIVSELGLDSEPLLVTGRKFRSFIKAPSVTEPEAAEYALDFIRAENGGTYDALVSAGGETFMVYTLDKNQKISGISTGNKCAAGTGEFFLQQIRRMDLDINQAIDLAGRGEPYLVTGRCSVFCKSDCTHALNKGVSVSNVTAGLCQMIAQKIVEIVARVSHNKILLVGGTALNAAVVAQLRRELGEVTVPKEAAYFEALGAALLAFDRGTPLPPDLFHAGRSNFSFLEPLPDYESLVTFNGSKYHTAQRGDRCLLGLDVGSTTTKAVLIREEDQALLGSVYLRTNGKPVEASRSCFQGLLEKLAGTEVDIIGIGVTGSGRQIAGLYTLTEAIINEIICHATAAVYFDSEVDTIFEIGGQDAKYTHITGSVASDYAMNEACSAGTGSFLEEAAFETLGVRMEEIADLALQAERPPNFNDQCAAFISSDIKNAAQEGITRNDILAGLVYSICFNYVNRVKGNRPMGKKIFMQGGICYNRAVPLAMAGILKKQIIVPPAPGLMGAFGVALELKKRIDLGLIKEKKFDLKEIVKREVSYEKSFVCAGGKEKCDLKCKIARVRIGSAVYPFGGSCNRYYNIRFKQKVDDESLDYVKVRNELMFGKYAPPGRLKPETPVIGLNTSFLTMRLFPLYYNFFSRLGCRIVLPDRVEPDAVNHLVTSMCFPAEVAIGLYENLVLKKPDYVFLPHVPELYVPKGIEKLDFCATCAFTQGEGFWLRGAVQVWQSQTPQNNGSMPEMCTPTINFNGGWEKGRKAFVETACKIGFSEKAADDAFAAAVEAQYAFEEECRQTGTRLLEKIQS